MYLCVLGDIENRGEISMTARGTYNEEGQNVYLWKNIDDTFEFVPAEGGKGGNTNEDGKQGENRQTGGGGSGGVEVEYGGRGGEGSSGTSYSGGSGGGGTTRTVGGAAGANGGARRKSDGAWSNYGAGGGAGNPGGKAAWGGGSDYWTAYGYAGENGTGGLLIMYAGRLFNEGTISSNGSRGGNGYMVGGSSGGGSINIFAKRVMEYNDVIADGGDSRSYGRRGFDGGNGTITVNEVDSVLNYPEKIVEVNINENYQIDTSKLSYTELNDIQTENLIVGALRYESLDTNIIEIDNTGLIIPRALGTTKVKIIDETNEQTGYIIVKVVKGVTSAKIEEGTNYTLGLKENGTVWEYGKNGTNEPAQVKVNGIVLTDIVDIGAGDENGIAVNKNGEIFTWGTSGEKTYVLQNIKKVHTKKGKFYAVDKDGNLYTWQGNGAPSKVNTNIKITDVDGNMLLGENGRVYDLENLSEEIKYTKNIADISNGEDHNVFATLDGYVYGIGKSDLGQIGYGKLDEKTEITLAKTDEGYIKDAINVSAGIKKSAVLGIDRNSICIWK